MHGLFDLLHVCLNELLSHRLFLVELGLSDSRLATVLDAAADGTLLDMTDEFHSPPRSVATEVSDDATHSRSLESIGVEEAVDTDR